MLKKILLLTLTICAVASLSISQPAYAQINEFKLTASDSAAGDFFGFSVSISGDDAIVGARWDDDAGDRSGSAYIFVRGGEIWTEQAKLTASDAAAEDEFGYSVSISGDYAIVGAYAHDDAGANSGSAYIFVRVGQSWTEQARLTDGDGEGDDQFGWSVSMSGNYAIVGANWDNDAGHNSGSAYIFVRDGQSWTEQAKLTASDATIGDQFGTSVSISSNYAIVGSANDDDVGFLAGSAYIFVRDGQSWTEEAKLTAGDAAQGDIFGWSVSMSGDYAIVGGTSQRAYIFIRDGQSWTEQARLTAGDAAGDDQFGESVSISGNYAIVGDEGADDRGFNAGAAYIFVRDGQNWTEQARLTAGDATGGDKFGISVSISGDYAIVGAWNDDDGAGSAYVYSGITVGIDDEIAGLPAEFALSQNYPNPFNPITNLSYGLPQQSDVTLIIYNIIGQEIMRWDENDIPAGYYEQTWNGTNKFGVHVGRGVYLYRLVAGDFVETRKMVLLK